MVFVKVSEQSLAIAALQLLAVTGLVKNTYMRCMLRVCPALAAWLTFSLGVRSLLPREGG